MGLFDKVKDKADSIKERAQEESEAAKVKGDLVLSPRVADGFVGVWAMDGLPYELMYVVESAHADSLSDDLLSAETGVVEKVDVVPLTEGYTELYVYLTAEGRRTIRLRGDEAFTAYDDRNFSSFLVTLEDDLLSFATDLIRKEGVVVVSAASELEVELDGDILVAVLGDVGEYEDVHAFEDDPIVADYDVAVLEEVHVIEYELFVKPTYLVALESLEGEYYREDPELVDEYVRRVRT